MGYWVSKLKNIPNSFGWYFFLIGDYRNHNVINDLFRDDFNIIAERIGSDAAIIAQNRLLENELQSVLKNVGGGKLGELFRNMERHNPGLLIINKNPIDIQSFSNFIKKKTNNVPDDLDYYQRKEFIMKAHDQNKREYIQKRKDDVIVYIPFKTLEKAYDSTNSLLSDIVLFSKSEDKSLLQKTSKFGKVMKKLDVGASLSINLGIIAFNIDV